ncbi:MAG TPA: MurT ligase domain-containing protein [Chloroflexota bacterium]
MVFRAGNPGGVQVSPRTMFAVLAGKAAGVATRSLGKGGGTSLPGLIATRIQPPLVKELAAQLEAGAIVVSGTNGKTTTSRMLASILTGAEFTVLRNASGSNLTRGVASALVARVNVWGTIRGDVPTLGLFEVDEAALPEVVEMVQPSKLLLNNLFRDQLDRYGEVATVARLWSSAISRLPPSAIVIANADDPLVAEVAAGSSGNPLYFGISSVPDKGAVGEHASDVKSCPRCGGPIAYSLVTLGHLGHYRCTYCEFARPEPVVCAENVRLRGIDGSDFTLCFGDETVSVRLPLPGLYNVYNALAAAAAASALGVDLSEVGVALGHVTAAFGRMERLDVDGHIVYLALAKNPAGFNEVMRTILQSSERANLLVLLNDNTADGHDVSWIWDADVEMLAGHVAQATFSGTRAPDMALRFKYAEVVDGRAGESHIESNTGAALARALAGLNTEDVLFVVPTYTAMLDVRGVLTRLGHVKPYWEE